LNGSELPPFLRVVVNAPSINEHYLDDILEYLKDK